MNMLASTKNGSSLRIAGSPGVSAQPMKIVLHPVVDPLREIDITKRLVSAIADELWELYGGNGDLNWLEAEAHLRQIVFETTVQAAGTETRHGRANGSAGKRDGRARQSVLTPS